MKIAEDIARKHRVEAAKEQVAADYRSKGYSITEEEQLGNGFADLVARKNKEVIVFEFKSRSTDRAWNQALAALRNHAVHKLGAQFRVVFVPSPNEIEVNIDGLDDFLVAALRESPDELDSLATHVRVEEVDGIETESVVYGDGKLRLKGSATVYVDLQYGSDSDMNSGDGTEFTDAYPFKFYVSLDPISREWKVEQLEIDTSSFYQ